MNGYSDRINHALAFAAKHHDQLVRRGVRLPYLTHPPNVGFILTRYGCDEDTVVAGILLNVVRDFVTDGLGPAILQQRIGDKFGHAVLDIALGAVPRRVDDAGVELSPEERRSDVVARLPVLSNPSRWVLAADALHDAASTLAELRRTIDTDVVWAKRSARDPAWYRRLVHALRATGFSGAIVDELDEVVAELERPR